MRNKKFILWFDELSNKDVPLVGGKNASLGEMYSFLKKDGINVPNGFALTAFAYDYFLEKAGIRDDIERILKGLDTHNMNNLSRKGHDVRETILAAHFPVEIEEELLAAYKKLGAGDVAVRSSATAEDLPDASFAGQQETFLNVQGEHEVLEATKKCIASLFTNRAISYREDKGFSHFDISLSVCVQKMVRSDLAGSGVMFTIDTDSGFEDAIIINAAFGLGEMVVQGKVEPDEYIVFDKTLQKDFKFKPIIGKNKGLKKIKMVYSREGVDPVREVPVSEDDRKKFVLNDNEILKLAYWGKLIEEHYKRPMDIEWAKDGQDGKLYILQARPETVQAIADQNILKEYILEKQGKVLTEGVAVGSRIGQGKAHIIKDVKDIGKFKKGEVLVTEITDPDWEPIMKIAAAIVTNSGGRTSHAAIVSRELGIPCLVGTQDATKVTKNGQEITICSAEGEIGRIYDGKLPFHIKKTNLKKLVQPKTKIMEIVADPTMAFDNAMIPNRGVGLLREELIFVNHIKVHPLALLNFNKIKDENVKDEINELVAGYKSKNDYFVDKLAEGVGRIAAAFYPEDVIVRTSDFKSNEYAQLLGGAQFEPHEENPMLGWRGASRYYSKEYRPAFDLECKALKKVREEMGLTNLKIMFPFVRTVDEAKKVLKICADNGLKRGVGGLEFYMMVEVPSNVILADKFAPLFDGFSIGSNDLTQLTLGLDRDSGLIADVGNERNQAVKDLLCQVIKIAKKNKTKIGICGQAPSDFPDLAKFLVGCGIDSISLNPDSVLKTTVLVEKYEKISR
ncbi:phosphoenolpyruvate synthase [Patescibacteria group bacterium]|nr:phosphoenolpyruvate synthase [Patescibacteria group bacterium]MBU1673299.1 phosphoenolpyruvate synthase [Patescibacteria group bacterium]MBU1963209.1 phosphoenolpyruvate synthase [Patescibacteria group bacterium]